MPDYGKLIPGKREAVIHSTALKRKTQQSKQQKTTGEKD